MPNAVFKVDASVAANFKAAADAILAVQRQLSASIKSDQADLAEVTQKQAAATKDFLVQRYADQATALKQSISTSISELDRYKAAWQDLINAVSKQNVGLAQQFIARGNVLNPQTTLPQGAVAVPAGAAGGAGGGGAAPPQGAPGAGGGGFGAIAPALAQAGASASNLIAQFVSAQLIAYAIRGAVLDVVHGLEDAVKQGIELNKQFELLRVGVAATLAQNTDIVTAQGQQLKGVQAVIAAQQLSANVQDKIVAAALQSGTALEPFVEAFRLSLPLALQMGASLDQSIDIVKRLALAANEIGIPFEQVKFQLSQILRGSITSRTTLARELGITQEDLTNAREQGTIIEFLTQKTQAYVDATGQLANTFAFVSTQVGILKDKVLQLVTQGGFDEIRGQLKAFLDEIYKINPATQEIEWNPDFKQAIDDAKAAFSSLTDAVIQSAPLMIKALEDVAAVVADLTAGMGLVVAGILKIRDIGDEKTAAIDRAQAKDILSNKNASPQEQQIAKDLAAHADFLDKRTQSDEAYEESASRAWDSVRDAVHSADKAVEAGSSAWEKAEAASIHAGIERQVAIREAAQQQEALNEAVTRFSTAPGPDSQTSAYKTFSEALAKAKTQIDQNSEAAKNGTEVQKKAAEEQRKAYEDASTKLAEFQKGPTIQSAGLAAQAIIGLGQPTTVPHPEEPSLKEQIAQFQASAEGQVLEIEKQRVQIEQQLQNVRRLDNGLTQEERTNQEGILRIKDAQLAVEQARAKVAGDQKALTGTDAAGVEKENLIKKSMEDQLALQRAIIAESKVETDVANANELARIAAERASYESLIGAYSAQEADLKLKIFALEKGILDTQVDQTIQQKAQAEVDAAQLALKKAQADLSKEELAATPTGPIIGPVRPIEQNPRVAAAKNEVAAAQDLLNSAIENQNALQQKTFGLNEVEIAQEKSKLEVASAVIALKRQQLELAQAEDAANLKGADPAAAAKRVTDALKAVSAAEDEVQEKQLAGAAEVFNAQQRYDRERVNLANQSHGIALGQDEINATRQLITLEEQLGETKLKHRPTDAAETQELANQIALIRAQLEVEKAINAEEAARFTLLQAQRQYKATVDQFGENSPQALAAAQQQNQAILQLQQAQLGVMKAEGDQQLTIANAADAAQHAFANQVASADGMLTNLHNISAELGAIPGKLTEGFRQFAQISDIVDHLVTQITYLSQQGLKDFISQGGPALIAGLGIAGYEAGGRGALGAIGAAGGAGAGIFGTLAGIAKKSGHEGAASGFGTVAGGLGEIASGVGGLNPQTATPLSGAQGGASIGQGVGAIAGLIPVVGPIIQAIAPVVGAVFGAIKGNNAKNERKIAQQIQQDVADTVRAIQEGSATVKTTLAELQQERDRAVATISSKSILQPLLNNIDNSMAQVRAQQKQILDNLNLQLEVLSAPVGIQDLSQAFADLNKNVQDYINAGATAAQVSEYLNLSIQKIAETAQQDFNDAEKNAIDLLQKENQLQQQKADLLRTTSEQIQSIQASEGIGFLLTPSQQAARQIRDIQISRDEQLRAINNQIAETQAQLGPQQQLFKLSSDQAQLEQQKLVLMQAQTAETVKQVTEIQQFLTLNAGIINAAIKAIGTTVIPNLAGLPGVQGGVVTGQTANVLSAVTVDTSGLKKGGGLVNALGVETQFNEIVNEYLLGTLSAQTAIARLQPLLHKTEGYASGAQNEQFRSVAEQMVQQMQQIIENLQTGALKAQNVSQIPPSEGGTVPGSPTNAQPIPPPGGGPAAPGTIIGPTPTTPVSPTAPHLIAGGPAPEIPSLLAASAILKNQIAAALPAGVGALPASVGSNNNINSFVVDTVNITPPAGVTPQQMWTIVQQGIKHGIQGQGYARTGPV